MQLLRLILVYSKENAFNCLKTMMPWRSWSLNLTQMSCSPTCWLSSGQPGRSHTERQEEGKPEWAPESRHSSGRRGETQSSKARLRQHLPFACCPVERRPPTPRETVRQLPAAELQTYKQEEGKNQSEPIEFRRQKSGGGRTKNQQRL